MLLKPAGTRPEPAVSVPSAKATSPRETTTAEPELDPPLIRSASKVLLGRPYGERAPTSPVANWSRLVLPRQTAPASISRATTAASRCGVKANAGHAAVVGRPATSMLSLTAKGTPKSGIASMALCRSPKSAARLSSRSICASSWAASTSAIQATSGSAVNLACSARSRVSGDAPPA